MIAAPAVHWNLQWSDPLIVAHWTKGPEAIVALHNTAYNLGYRIFMGRFIEFTRREQAHHRPQTPEFARDLRLMLSDWRRHAAPDAELVYYVPPDPKLDDVASLLDWQQNGWTLAWDRIAAQSEPSARLQLAFDRANEPPTNMIEPFWGLHSWHGAFYDHRCVVTFDQYVRRTESGKRPDVGPMPDVYIQPDERWVADHRESQKGRFDTYDAMSVRGLSEFCLVIAADDRAEARRLPMLPLDLVMRLSFDARPFVPQTPKPREPDRA